jgi:hypothetical protein
VKGTPETRDKMLEAVIQLGVGRATMSWSTWIKILILSFASKFSFGNLGLCPPPNTSAGDRTLLPAVKVADCGKTFHFGGPQDSSAELPDNYVAASLELGPINGLNFLPGWVVGFLEQKHGGIDNKVVDCTLLLSGSTLEELPERALGTFRFINGEGCGLEPHYIWGVRDSVVIPKSGATRGEWQQVTDAVTTMFRVFVSDPFNAAVSPVARVMTPRTPSTMHIQSFLREKQSRPSMISSSDPFEAAVNELLDVLDDAEVPVRQSQISDSDELSYCSDTVTEDTKRDKIRRVPVLTRFDRSDIRRYFIATGCNLPKTSIRIIESAAWHGLTFPIDTQACRVELQNGQSFQQGHDKRGNPVFYYRNMCLGPWRRDEDAVIAAAIHRFQRSLTKLKEDNPEVQFTVIVSMGKPFRESKKEVRKQNQELAKESKEEDDTTADQDEGVAAIDEAYSDENNPRIDAGEQWQVQTSERLVKRLIHILQLHYPERLNRALVVVGHGNKAYVNTIVGGNFNLSKYVKSSRTRDKVKFMHRYADLQAYVEKEQLVTCVGGSAQIDREAFACE